MWRLKPLIQTIRVSLAPIGTVRSLLVRGVSGTIALIAFSTTINFGIALALARMLGTAGYGTYSYAIAWISLLTVPALLGFERLLIRNVAVLDSSGDWSMLKGLLQRSTQLIIGTSLFLTSAVLIFILSFTEDQNSEMTQSLLLALVLLPIFSMTRLRKAAMQGFNRVVAGQIPERVVHPLLFLAFLIAVWALPRGGLTAVSAIGLHILAAAVAFAVGTTMLVRALPPALRTTAPSYATRIWLRSAMPLLAVSGMYVVVAQTDIIMLGALAEAKDVGIYRAVTRGAGFISFSFFAVNPALGPIIARLYHSDELHRLQRVVTATVRVVVLLALPLGMFFIIGGEYYLRLFGPEFVEGRSSLIILSMAHLANALAGAGSLILIMTGYERDAALGVAAGAIANVFLNALLIPRWGMEGAAIATGASLIMCNVVLVLQTRRRLGIRPTALGFV